MADKQNIKTLNFGDRDYPAKLKEFLKDPKTIYYLGDITMADEVSIAVVGSLGGNREASCGIWCKCGQRTCEGD